MDVGFKGSKSKFSGFLVGFEPKYPQVSREMGPTYPEDT